MCNQACVEFGKNLAQNNVQGKRVLEIGSLDLNGTLANHIKRYSPSEYIGIDLESGKGVDLVMDVHDILKEFGPESFDVVVSTEMMEHIKDWKDAIKNMKGVLRENGYILITTRSKGFGLHGYPTDYWRYEISDMMKIFSDFEVIKCESDLLQPGVFLFARKPTNYKQNSLKGIELYDITKEKK